ncbi:MAG: hypothetical protein QNL04_03595, partial [SAR324 cluster bacterium]|nr:hypothetical protein [SAR324 cluster bacterium]
MRQITIFFLFVFFSLSQITFAQPMALIEGFDSETTRHAQKINQLLNAYQLESSGDLKRAKKTWGLAPDSLTKSNHLFFIQFFLNKPIPPTSKTQVVFQGNYYLWRHQYAKANKLLESRAILSASEKILLIHAQLALGKYQKAAKALAQ